MNSLYSIITSCAANIFSFFSIGRDRPEIFLEEDLTPFVLDIIEKGKADKKGGMACVYFVKVKGVSCAIKTARNDMFFLDDILEKEAALLKQLYHAHITKPLAEVRVQQKLYLFMEHGGKDLQRVLKERQEGFLLAEVYLIARQVFSALEYLKSKNIAHGDIKPANILYDKQVVTLIDFGLAFEGNKKVDVRGSQAYMAPEMLMNDVVSSAVDVWAVAAVLFESYTTEKLFPLDRLTPIEQISVFHEAVLEKKYPEKWQKKKVYKERNEILEGPLSLRKKIEETSAAEPDKELFVSHLMQMLEYDPLDRLCPLEGLKMAENFLGENS